MVSWPMAQPAGPWPRAAAVDMMKRRLRRRASREWRGVRRMYQHDSARRAAREPGGSSSQRTPRRPQAEVAEGPALLPLLQIAD